MYELTELPNSSGINTEGNGTTFQGISIEEKIRRLTENKEPIEEALPIVYTPSNEGVLPAYNIRADKWDIAIDAMNKITEDKVNKWKSKQEQLKELEGNSLNNINNEIKNN